MLPWKEIHLGLLEHSQDYNNPTESQHQWVLIAHNTQVMRLWVAPTNLTPQPPKPKSWSTSTTQGNHLSITKINQVMATVNKEECNNYAVHIPQWCWCFIPHCFVTPQQKLSNKERSQPNLLCFKEVWNSMTSTPCWSKLDCKFGSVHEATLICEYSIHLMHTHDNSLSMPVTSSLVFAR